MIALKHILLPTDFSDASMNALRYARAFAKNFQATIHLLHVIDLSFVAAWEGSAPAIVREDVERHARQRLEQLLADAPAIAVQRRVVDGSPFVEIVRYAREQNIDLIVMGTHGRGPVAHMLLGSVAEKVVRKASCPVLTVRHPEHEFVRP